VPVQFSYLVQNPDGSTSTQGAVADRPPTWGELQDHVASTGGTLLPATPAEQPPPAQRAAPAEQPPPAAPPPAPLPTAVEQTSGGAPTPVNPPRTLGSYALPAGSAALGAWALPAAATAIAGPLSWPALAGMAALGAYGGGFTGEYGQAELERATSGEPPPGAPTPWERAQEFGKTAGQTEALVQTAMPLVAPVVRTVLRPAGSTAVRSAAEAGPLLRTGALPGGEAAAVEGGQSVARSVADDIERGHAIESIRVGASAPTVPVNTDPLVPLVNSTRNALARQGANADQLALFDRNMMPISQGGPQPLSDVLSAERNLNRWTANMPRGVALPELDTLTTTTRNAVGDAVQGTPAAQPFQQYRDTQTFTAPLRTSLREAGSTASEGFQPWLAGADGQMALKAMIEHAAPEDAAKLGKAWLVSTRQAARTAADPVQYMADAYNALPVPFRTKLFGQQTPALGQLIGEASGAAPPGLRLPAVGTIQVARPWARSVLLSPAPAATLTSAVRPVLGGLGRAGLYTAVQQTSEPRPSPTELGP